MKKNLVLILALLLNTNACLAFSGADFYDLVKYHREYYPNTKILKSKYKQKDGLINGKLYSYNENGELTSKEKYELGKKQGFSYAYTIEHKIKKYYENDVLQYEKIYNKKNAYLAKNTYENGVLAYREDFLKDGREYKKTIYKENKTNKVILTFYKDINSKNELFSLNNQILPKELREITFGTTIITNEIYYSENKPKTNDISYFNKNGAILWKLKYKGEKLTNSIIYVYNENKKLDSELDTNLVKNSKKITTYHPTGTIKTIQEYSQNPEDKEFNIANGVFYTYKENEKIISKILYKNNKIIENELWEYYPTGELYIKATNKNNQASGKYLEYAQNGIIVVDENYLNNKPDGVKKEYYRNGNIKFVGYYKGGLPYGKSTSYWRNGNLSNETNYLNGKKHGVSKSYWENGNIAFYDTYSNGTITSKKAYDMYGKELWSQKY